MTNEKKQIEIGNLIMRLSDLRGELGIASRKLRELVSAVIQAGHHYEGHGRTPKPKEWPSTEIMSNQEKSVTKLRQEAGSIISTLKTLGVDEELFKINGEHSG